MALYSVVCDQTNEVYVGVHEGRYEKAFFESKEKADWFCNLLNNANSKWKYHVVVYQTKMTF